MSIGVQRTVPLFTAAGAAVAQNLHDTSVATTQMITAGQFEIKEVGVQIAVATDSVETVTVKRITAVGTSATICTFPISAANGLAVGRQIRASVHGFGDTTLGPGDIITMETGGTGTAGTGNYFIVGIELESGPQAGATGWTSVAKEPASTGTLVKATATEV